MSSDCDDDRLLIDDNNDVSINEGDTENRKASSPISGTTSDGCNEVNNAPEPVVEVSEKTQETEPSNGILDASREEGELVDEEMDVSQADVTGEKAKNIDASKRDKRSTTPSSKLDGPSVKKGRVNIVTKHDKSTCVQSRAIQNEGDECPFDMEPGSSFTVQMTVVCRLEGANTLYVTSKWKDQELTGVLTDGVPPGFQNLMKKSLSRNQNGGNYASSGGDGEKAGNQPTPSKKRLGRNFQTEVRRRSARPAADNGNEEIDDELDVANTESRPASGTGSITLTEVAECKSMHECPYDGCFYRFEKGVEMDYHVNIVHKMKAIMRESICSQTEISAFRRNTVSTETDPIPEEIADSKENGKQLCRAGTSGIDAEIKEEAIKRTGSPFSDISEPDDAAPRLQKEENRSDSNVPKQSNVLEKPVIENNQSSGIATVTPMQASSMMDPQTHPAVASLGLGGSRVTLPTNGLFTSALQANNPFQSPRMPQQEHKIHQLKQDGQNSDSASSSNVPIAPKPMSSPAQPRPAYSMPTMTGHPNHPLMQPHTLPQQAAMQMIQLALGRGYPAPNLGAACTPDQLAQIAAMQASLPPSFGNMYPK